MNGNTKIRMQKMLKKLNAIEKWKSAGYVRVLDMFKGSGMAAKP